MSKIIQKRYRWEIIHYRHLGTTFDRCFIIILEFHWYFIMKIYLNNYKSSSRFSSQQNLSKRWNLPLIIHRFPEVWFTLDVQVTYEILKQRNKDLQNQVLYWVILLVKLTRQRASNLILQINCRKSLILTQNIYREFESFNSFSSDSFYS